MIEDTHGGMFPGLSALKKKASSAAGTAFSSALSSVTPTPSTGSSNASPSSTDIVVGANPPPLTTNPTKSPSLSSKLSSATSGITSKLGTGLSSLSKGITKKNTTKSKDNTPPSKKNLNEDPEYAGDNVNDPTGLAESNSTPTSDSKEATKSSWRNTFKSNRFKNPFSKTKKNAKPEKPIIEGDILKEYPYGKIDVIYHMTTDSAVNDNIKVSVTHNGKKLLFDTTIPPDATLTKGIKQTFMIKDFIASGEISKEYPDGKIDVSFRLPEGAIKDDKIKVSVTKNGKKLMFNFVVPSDATPESKMTQTFNIKDAVTSSTSFTNRFSRKSKTDPTTTIGKVLSESNDDIEASFFLPDGAKVQDKIKVSVTTLKGKNLMFNFVVPPDTDLGTKITKTFKIADAIAPTSWRNSIPSFPRKSDETTIVQVKIPDTAKTGDTINAPFKYKGKDMAFKFVVLPEHVPGTIIPVEVKISDAITPDTGNEKIKIEVTIPPGTKPGSTIKAPFKHEGKDLVFDFVVPPDAVAGSTILAEVKISDAIINPAKNADLTITNDEQKKDMSKRCIDIMDEMNDPNTDDARKRELLIQLAKHLIILATLLNK